MRIGAGRLKGRRLPEARAARPIPGRLRTSLFSILRDDLPGARILDLCAGIGALGLEALSHGAAEVCLVDVDRGAVTALQAWIDAAGEQEAARAIQGRWEAGSLPEGPFDLVFLDPPFEQWGDANALEAGLERIQARLAEGGRLIAKVPDRGAPPEFPGFRALRRGAAASVAYVILESEPPSA